MKKIYSMMMIAMMAFTFTACEDEMIADTLEGTWSGNMYVSSYYNGGYWVDYYSGAPWDYVANHISWRVDNGHITVYFIEDGTSVVIDNYHLSDSHFTGYIADGDNDVHFNLTHISSPNWDSYDTWGYDGWYYDSYWARGTRAGDGNDSIAVTTEKPVRQFGKKTE